MKCIFYDFRRAITGRWFLVAFFASVASLYILTVPIESLVQGSVPIKNDGQLPNDFLDAVHEITKGCSKHTLQTMLDVLIAMARHDKEN